MGGVLLKDEYSHSAKNRDPCRGLCPSSLLKNVNPDLGLQFTPAQGPHDFGNVWFQGGIYLTYAIILAGRDIRYRKNKAVKKQTAVLNTHEV